MSDNTYNGWTNRATWLVNVWFNPESREDLAMARETLESAIEELPDFLKDFVDTDINWSELEAHFDEDESDEDEDTEEAIEEAGILAAEVESAINAADAADGEQA